MPRRLRATILALILQCSVSVEDGVPKLPKHDVFEGLLRVEAPLKEVVPSESKRIFFIPILERYTLVGTRADPTDSVRVHHMKLQLRISHDACKQMYPGSGLERHRCVHGVTGYDAVAVRGCRGPMLTWGANLGINVGPETPFDAWIIEIHNNAELLLDRSGFELAVNYTTRATEIIKDVGSTGVAKFSLEPNSAYTRTPMSEPWRVPFPVRLKVIHGHFHRWGTAQVFFLNGLAIGSWTSNASMEWCTPERGTPGADDTERVDDAMLFLSENKPIWLNRGDNLTTACEYDTRGANRAIAQGKTAEDEMCNMFILVAVPCSQLNAMLMHNVQERRAAPIGGERLKSKSLGLRGPREDADSPDRHHEYSYC